jgi:predicted RNA-binding protein
MSESKRSYWLDLFTGQTWDEFLKSGASVSGYRPSRHKTVRRIHPGDYLLCYLTGVSRFIGVLEVTSEAFTDSTPIWKDEAFPERMRVKPLVALTPETAVPVHDLIDRFSWAGSLQSPIAWTGHFRGSPALWESVDGEVVVDAVLRAKAQPVVRPVDKAKLARRPTATKSPIGPVIIPEPESEPEAQVEADRVPGAGDEAAARDSAHTEIQWLLLTLGAEMGLDVWVARNDRSREYKGARLGDLPRVRKDLPLKFDPVTNKTIELIDVLWMRSNAIAAAFEVESTTSIYSGLLRMADLLALQPNLNIPLYIVAPDDRRTKVISEVNRPTFRRLDPPMAEVTRFISFSELREHAEQARPYLRHLKPDFIEEFSEPCDVEEQ